MKRGLAIIGVGLSISTLCAWACSSDETTGNTEPADPTVCGPGPYGQLTGNALEATADGTTKAKAEVVVSTDFCRGKTFTTAADGKVTFKMTKGKPVIFAVDHPDDLPTHLAEFQLDSDQLEGFVALVPKLFKAVLAPEFSETSTVVGLGIVFPTGTIVDDAGTDGGASDPCQRREGVTFSVPGHPEAKITYFNTEALPKPDPAATATSANGLARIEGLADGTTVEPIATKPGCTIVGKHDGFTGRLTVANGFFVPMYFLMSK